MEENNLYENGVIVSLSGGVDSMVLFSCLLRLQIKKKFHIYVVSINYNLRKESADEAKFIKNFCRNHNVIYLVKDLENTISSENQRGIYDNNLKRSEFGFLLPIKYTYDKNLWIYSIPKLFFRINYRTIKNKTIIKLLELINNKKGETCKKPRIILDSGFRASIKNNYLLIYHYSDILENKDVDKLTFDSLEEFNDLIC